jgi:hypothetical protein
MSVSDLILLCYRNQKHVHLPYCLLLCAAAAVLIILWREREHCTLCIIQLGESTTGLQVQQINETRVINKINNSSNFGPQLVPVIVALDSIILMVVFR